METEIIDNEAGKVGSNDLLAVNPKLQKDLSELLLAERIPLDIVDAETGLIIVPANRKITTTAIRKIVKRKEWIEIDPSPIRNKIIDTINPYIVN